MSEEQDIQFPEDVIVTKPQKKGLFRQLRKIFFWCLLCVICIFSAAYFFAVTSNQAPVDFPTGKAITIEPGTEVQSITNLLAREKVVKNETLLYLALVLLHEPADVKASTYVFETPLTTLEVATRLTQGDFNSELLRFTHIEGERIETLAKRASDLLPNFNAEEFNQRANGLEGKLFPDTYFIPESYTEAELLTLLRDTFTKRIQPLKGQISTHELTLDEIITLASILEREANSPESKKIVSGILQNRLDIGMALQADATIEYVIGTPLGELPEGQLAQELRELDSPYNSYLYPGLPPTPIGNPGLEAITAVLEPTPSEFFYYITGTDGEFYYAKTYDEHLVNIEKYLR